jgi:hypothetical protein
VDDDGYTSILNGLDTTKGLFFVGDAIEKPDLREIYQRALDAIPAFITMPPADGYVFGKEAYRKWADTLLDESRFAGKTDEEWNSLCWELHCSAFCNICTSAAEIFVRAAAEVYDLALAKILLPHYEKFTLLRKEIGRLHGNFFPPMDKFKTREFRTKIAAIVQQMGDLCDDIIMAFD